MNATSIERYDRQMRLWGQDGQLRCANAKVCVINADSLGLEVLRGLCLAGVGLLTIIDSSYYTQETIGASFIDQTKVGQSRAELAKAMLTDIDEQVHCEMYPIEAHLPHATYVQGTDCVPNETHFWKQFDCVIASGNLSTDQINLLSDICWSENIPLIQGKSIGFYGFMRSQFREHKVDDTHPDWLPANFDKDELKKVVRTSGPIRSQFKSKTCDVNNEDSEDDLITEFICLNALDLFFSTYSRLPGCTQDQLETDITKLKDCVKNLVGKSCNKLKTLDQCIYELCRYGGTELHTTSAFLGGCIAQETIKIVTNQYVPVEDTLVYSSMTATTKAFRCSDVFPI